MSEKRFYITDTGLGLDTESDEMYSFGDEDSFCRLFDKLNKQQATIQSLKEENKQLKEQLQMIERIIQTQLTEKEEDLRTSVKGGMPTGGLYSKIRFLEKLKKECFDDE